MKKYIAFILTFFVLNAHHMYSMNLFEQDTCPAETSYFWTNVALPLASIIGTSMIFYGINRLNSINRQARQLAQQLQQQLQQQVPAQGQNQGPNKRLRSMQS